MGSNIRPPGSESPDLHLCQPTPKECTQIWFQTAESWKDYLTSLMYIVEAQYLATVPLAKNGGITIWILVGKNRPPSQRQILCSCESFRKRCLISDKEGNIQEGIVHGVASVFCTPEYRGRGYGTRFMKELAQMLKGWQPEHGKSIGSVLYSDSGRDYYAKLGWHPNPRNWHFMLPSVRMETPWAARLIPESELENLCRRDEEMVQRAMTTPSTACKRVVILPDLDHMLWHIRKEDFATDYIFEKKAEAKGAIAGIPGRQVWILWARRYYEHPAHSDEEGDGKNVLYVLRLVIEGDHTANKPHDGHLDPPPTDILAQQAAALKAVLQAAQAEAAEWLLSHVQLWEPSPLAQSLLEQSGLDAIRVERQTGSVASALWFREDNDVVDDAPQWVNNERYAWC